MQRLNLGNVCFASSPLAVYVLEHHHTLLFKSDHLGVCFLQLLFHELLVQRVRYLSLLLVRDIFLQSISPEFSDEVHQNLKI